MIPVIDAKVITPTNIIYKYKAAEIATEYLVSKKQYIILDFSAASNTVIYG